ncbi:transporter protein (transporter, major facilitator superfamily mfs 1) [Lacticaseibacillus pantheris DSM 15945 = JCM 12539 = NBRC 106106]|uniref:Transporter protein (Transporter, major facilitator superfamily mfs 1) n=1 Tax=Lacticaseibacillus pantheris DSM 15945 = JCM 12539 = NBRC 106106 TaxID=1423783 RepID=A0A0R1TVY1_9LACO|nr:MFS transporter [Lacticaseibacillus pantheris]KRL85388.1 transporter protein (transporter, major facilitator superfamily mfs 1) [Lacticaseibacillus pantheris DSM 15945 = JCM 12539 = NBRC 106106]
MRRYSSLFFLVMFLIGTDTFLVSPLLPTLSRLFGISTAVSGWLVSAYALGYAGFAVISGPISDQHDRKQILLYGLAGFAVSTALCGVATSFWLMLLFRFLAGVAAAFVTPQVWASIPDVVEPKQIVKVMGYATAGLSVAQLVGIPIGSYLAAGSWHTPFFVIAGAAVLLMVVCWQALPALPSQHAHIGFWRTYKQVIGNHKAVSYLAAYFVFQTGSFTAITFISTWFTRDFGLTLTGVGTAMIGIGAGNLLGSLLSGYWAKKVSFTRALALSFVALIVLYIGLTFSPSFIVSEIMVTTVYVFNGLIFPLLMTTLQQTVANARSTMSSLANAAMYLGETMAGGIGGLLFNAWGFTGIAWFAAIVIAFGGMLYWYHGALNTTAS